MPDKQAQFARIKTLIFGVDGIFIDGRVCLLATGEQYRTFDIKNCYSIELALKTGFWVGIVLSTNAEGVKIWLEILGVEDIFMGGLPDQKLNAHLGYVTRDGLNESEILYMGDDIIDCPILNRPDMLATCPADAVEEVKVVCDYISPKPGRGGAVRDVVEQVLKAQRKWIS